MRRVLVVIAVLGCSRPKHEPPPPPPAPTPVDAAVAPLPAHGVPNSAVASAPRKDWPCRMVTKLDATSKLMIELSYGARTTCWLPVDIAGSRELVGCPDERVEQNLTNTAKLDVREHYSYDDQGHLISVTTYAGVFAYRWDGDLVASRTQKDHAPVGYTSNATGADIAEDVVTEHAELAGGHLARYRRGEVDDITFTWQGTRLVGVHDVGTTSVDYDCSKPSRLE